MIEKLLRPHRVAEILGCSRNHVYDLINAGKFVVIKIGEKAKGITVKSLEEFQNKNRVAPEQ